MARLPRLAQAGGLHHIGLRGHDGETVFRDDQDRTAFLAMLRDAALAAKVAVHGYALLTSEVQLLATPELADGLSRLMQSLGRRYGAAFNRRHSRSGGLWDGRFRCSLLEAESALLDATVFVETLPVEAGLAVQPSDWPWSSASHHTGRRRDPLIVEHPYYWSMGNTPFERELAHANLLVHGISAIRRQQLHKSLARGHALGRAPFLAELASRTERPLVARPRGRPRSAKTMSPNN